MFSRTMSTTVKESILKTRINNTVETVVDIFSFFVFFFGFCTVFTYIVFGMMDLSDYIYIKNNSLDSTVNVRDLKESLTSNFAHAFIYLIINCVIGMVLKLFSNISLLLDISCKRQLYKITSPQDKT